MRRINIFVSSPADVQQERSVVERLIRSIAAEFHVPVTISYPNRRRNSKPLDGIADRAPNGHDEGGSLLCPCFWEYQDFKPGQEYRERIPNTGQYDLVVCILWSRLGNNISPAFLLPDGSQPKSSTEYEIAWVLDQRKRTPVSPELHVYRNLSIPIEALEPLAERETAHRQRDSVREFFLSRKSDTAFSEASSEYRDLQEFENLFRNHFRNFVAKKLDREIVSRKPAPNAPEKKWNPFRGLQCFNFEDAAVFHGRTKANGEVLDVLKEQANFGQPFVLIVGPNGSGKSSLARAGILPLLTGTGSKSGLWRRAITRPGAGDAQDDSFNRLAGALLAEEALPELRDPEIANGEKVLASELRENPEGVARRITELLDRAGGQRLEWMAAQVKNAYEMPGRIEGADFARDRSSTKIRPEERLALIVDPLEELFTGDLPPDLQHRYIAALVTLIRSGRVFVIATLRSDAYAAFQQFPELIELIGAVGKYDLQPPTPEEIGNIIRLPAAAAGLRFEQDVAKGGSLAKTILDAAVSSREPLPLLEHLLSELYRKQTIREDGLLQWSDYRALGEFEGALVNHAERVFATLKSDAQGAFGDVMRRLVSFGENDQRTWRTALYRQIVPPVEICSRREEGAKNFVDSFIKEGLLDAEPDLTPERIICLSYQALLPSWPRFRQWLAEDQAFARMRDRLDESLNLPVHGDRYRKGLGEASFGASDAKTLIRHSRTCLSKKQIESIQSILATQKRDHRIRESVWLALGAGLIILAAVAGSQWHKVETHQKGAEELASFEREIVEISEKRHDQESEIKQPKDDSQTEQTSIGLPSGGVRALEAAWTQIGESQWSPAIVTAANSNLVETAAKANTNGLSDEKHLKDFVANDQQMVVSDDVSSQERLLTNKVSGSRHGRGNGTLHTRVHKASKGDNRANHIE